MAWRLPAPILRRMAGVRARREPDRRGPRLPPLFVPLEGDAPFGGRADARVGQGHARAATGGRRRMEDLAQPVERRSPAVRRLARLAATLSLAAAAALAQPVPADRAELRRLREQALRAHKNKDHPAFLELSRRLAQLLPRSNRALYNLACAHALSGEKADAVRILELLAQRGV